MHYTYTSLSVPFDSLRNPDLVTAVALLTQEPSTQKSILPTMLRDQWMVKKPMSAAEIRDTFVSMNDVLRTRLRLWELVPLELSEYTIGMPSTSWW